MIKLILFGILKGIGILLLVLLLLLLLMVLVVLLSPIRYHLEGEKRAAVSGSFGVSWLLGQSVPMAAIHLRGAVGSS
ncbi:MAG: hypothetical protein ACLSG1_02965 [Anaerotignum faecicola]